MEYRELFPKIAAEVDSVLAKVAPAEIDRLAGVESIQSMSTLFDQALHIFGDIVAVLIQERKGLKNKDLWKQHANLE